jgi:hypothetical protein
MKKQMIKRIKVIINMDGGYCNVERRWEDSNEIIDCYTLQAADTMELEGLYVEVNYEN